MRTLCSVKHNQTTECERGLHYMRAFFMLVKIFRYIVPPCISYNGNTAFCWMCLAAGKAIYLFLFIVMLNNSNIQNQSKQSSLVLTGQLSEMSSIEIAEVTGKKHAHIMRDIKNLLKQGVAESNFGLGSYTDANGQERPMYNLTKKGSLILASGYNAVLREKIIDRWESLETGKATPYYQIPQSFSEALMLAAKQAEQIESQQKQIQAQSNQIAELEKQTEYTRVILQSKSTALVTQIAQDYGMSARKFNAILRDLNIQHKVRNQWVLFNRYINKGYVQSSTFNFTRSDGR